MVAPFLSILLLTYHQATTWLPLYPWNDVARYSRTELLLEAGINGCLMLTNVVCLLAPNSGFFHWFPLLYFPFLLLGEAVDWWLPYLSESFARGRKIWDYEARFGRTVKLIPHRAGKRTPDANHIVLHAITVVAALAAFADRLK